MSISALSQIEMPCCPIRARVSGLTKAPPPVAITAGPLSSNRAMAARSQLLAGGMPATGILQVVGMADRAPIDTHDAAAAVNRRIELIILTEAQARNVAAMFGMPGEVQPLTAKQ